MEWFKRLDIEPWELLISRCNAIQWYVQSGFNFDRSKYPNGLKTYGNLETVIFYGHVDP